MLWYELCEKNNYVHFISYFSHIRGISVYMHKKLQTGQNVNNSDHTEVTFHGGYFLIWFFLLSKIFLIDKNYLLNKDKYHTHIHNFF